MALCHSVALKFKRTPRLKTDLICGQVPPLVEDAIGEASSSTCSPLPTSMTVILSGFSTCQLLFIEELIFGQAMRELGDGDVYV